jgi:hypothetical protein
VFPAAGPSAGPCGIASCEQREGLYSRNGDAADPRRLKVKGVELLVIGH